MRQTQVPGVNMASASAKADVVKEELEEAQNRVDQARVNNLARLFKINDIVCN